MKKAPAEDRRLIRLTKICLALPESTRRCSGQHAGFYVRSRSCGFFLKDQNAECIVSIAAKVIPGDNTALVAASPARFCLPAYVGSRGWVALRLDAGEIDWDEVAELVTGSYRLIAPKKLAALVKMR
jgi:hypothetical protein